MPFSLRKWGLSYLCGLGLLGLWSCSRVPLVSEGGSTVQTQAPAGLSAEALAAWQGIYQRHGLALRPFGDPAQGFTWWMALGGKAYVLSDLNDFDRLLRSGFFAHELDKYPPRFFTQAPLKEILFAAKTAGSVLAGGGVSQGFTVNALQQRLVVLSLDPAVYQVQDVAVALHHEIFHSIDDQPYTSRWRACHPQGFVYQGHGEAPTAQVYPAPGFVSDYARSDMREDRAEVFAWMMAAPELAQALQAYASQDKILACKQALIADYLVQHFPNFDAAQRQQVRWGISPEVFATLQNKPVRRLVLQRAPTALQTTASFVLPRLPLQLPELWQAYPRVTDFISDLPYTSVSEALFSAWPEMEHWELTAHRLTELPPGIADGYHLKFLLLRGRPLPSLPQNLEKLVHLQKVSVDLAGPIAADFSTLAFFRELDLRLAPPMTALPQGLTRQRFLPILKLRGEGLESVADLTALKNLRVLQLGPLPAWQRPLEEVQILVSALPKLERLVLSQAHWSEAQLQQLRQYVMAYPALRLELTP